MVKYALGLHTTTRQLGLSISNFDYDSRHQIEDLDRDLSTHLHLCLRDFLLPQTWEDLAFLAVAAGPGSFTSTRIGMVTARTISQQLNIPLFPISSLAALAWSQKNSSDLIAVEMEASRGQIFVAIYQYTEATKGLITYLADTATTKGAWQETLTQLTQPYELIQAKGDLTATMVESLLQLAYIDWQQGKRPHWRDALPFYGQTPVISS